MVDERQDSGTLKPTTAHPAIRVIMMPRDAQAEGRVFGGHLLSLMDQAAFAEALRQAHNRYVTVSVKEVEFHEPVYVGDVVGFYAETTRLGRTSLTIQVEVRADRRRSPGRNVRVAHGEVTIVAVNESGQPKPVFE